jgi:hypothetical protein
MKIFKNENAQVKFKRTVCMAHSSPDSMKLPEIMQPTKYQALHAKITNTHNRMTPALINNHFTFGEAINVRDFEMNR